MLFGKGEGQALDYLKKRVPPAESDKAVDLTRLNDKLFDVPDAYAAGRYDFEGDSGIHVSFNLADVSTRAFDSCYAVLKHNKTQGDWRPIYEIQDISIQTKGDSFDKSSTARVVKIYWLPDLRDADGSELRRYVDMDRGIVYLTGQHGQLARPADLLGLFHEVGHIETRDYEKLNAENRTIEKRVTSAGLQIESIKRDAYELQRERAADAWLLKNTRRLFEDIGVPVELVRDYIHHKQLKSYHDYNRREHLGGSKI